MRTCVDDYKTYLIPPYAKRVSHTLSYVGNFEHSKHLLRLRRIKTYQSVCDVFGAYTKLVYNEVDVFEKMPIRRVIRRKIRSCDRPITFAI